MEGRALCQRCYENQILYKQRLKDEVFEAYGGRVCACCGETEPLFLEIDHVDGQGGQHRRKHNLKSSIQFYQWLKKNDFPAGFQVLCRNCNWGKYVNGGVCPHKTK